MQILGVLVLYFDAAVVFVTKFSLYSDWLVAILWLHDLCFFFLPFLSCKVEMISRKIKFLKTVTLAGDQLRH